MGRILEHWRVPVATLFATVLVIGAYLLARGVEAPPAAQASTETALLKAIAAKDSDSDGLPDWEEALYGTDPNNPDSNHLGMTDGEAVAKGLIVPKAIADVPVATSTAAADSNTLTDAFAKSFFALYLTAKQANNGVELTGDQTTALADQMINQLSQTIAPTADFKSPTDLTVSGAGPDALREFAAAAEAVFKKNADTTATMSELEYFQAAVEGNDATALTHLTSLAKTYRDSAAGLAVLPVPQEVAADDLSIVNALMRLSQIDNDFARVNSDPLSAMLALQQFKQTELAAEQAFTSLRQDYTAAGVVLPAGTPGAAFVNLITDLGAQQHATTKKP